MDRTSRSVLDGVLGMFVDCMNSYNSDGVESKGGKVKDG